ncbi:MAG: Ig-like domain-containing protein, partial [Thermoplasmata archaeon]|nr:Ig-like domain-containing protein [Thermoplasmata archaeon]
KETTGITFDWTWSDNTKLKLCPQTNFQESRAVQVWVNGTDLEDFALVPNPHDPDVINPFVFVTYGFPPYILSTNPEHQETGVPDNADVVITWSKPMNNTSVKWRINEGWDPMGSPDNWTQNWNSPTDTVLTLSHAIPFKECDDLEFEVTAAKDKGGKDFEPMGSPNPWQFRIACISPYVVETDPHDGQVNVELNYPITVLFSEPMATGTLSHHITPSVTLSPVWSNWDQTLTVNHGLFAEGTPYEYCIDYIEDKEGYPLLVLPYCFTFTTISDNPYIAFTVPEDGETEVDPFQDVIITFSEEMNNASLTWTLSPNVPDKASWVEQWEYMNMAVRLIHALPMLYCTEYTFHVVDAMDPSGNHLIPGPVPNPWSFTTTTEYPCIVETDPVHGQTNVSLWKEIVITFDEPIDTSAPFNYLVQPTTGGTTWTETWSNGDKTVTLNHSLRLLPNEKIDVTVTEAYDLDGNPLKPGPKPNPFEFWTMPDPDWPSITYTSPENGEQFVLTDEPIVIIFSETMDTASVTWDIQNMSGPSPIVFVPSWSQMNFPDDTLTLTHVDPYNECDTYYVLIEGQDLDGNPLQNGPVPNPFHFDTICILPVITSTDPADQDVNVPLNKSIVIDFSEEMLPGSFVWTIVPNPSGWTETWSNGNSTVTLSHTNDFVQCTNHDVEVTQAWDTDFNNIIPGSVPNPWRFTTACVNPYIVSTDPYHGEIDVLQDRNVTVVFSEPMDTGTVVFEIQPSLPFNYVWSNNDTVLT